MGYREDIDANFPLVKPPITSTLVNSVIEDLLTDMTLDRHLQDKRNLVENRAKAAKDKFLKDNPEANQMDITPILLEKYDKGLTEAVRQVSSYEQGTISGKVRDSKDKIRNALETQITIQDK